MAHPVPSLDWRSAARVIDHSLLDPAVTREEIVRLCAEAERYGVAAVCVAPCWTALAAERLRTTPVRVASVVGFPHGTTLGSVKRFEALELVRLGADELDMMLNLGALKSGEAPAVEGEIRGVVEIARDAGALVKVILETSRLTQEEKTLACEMAVAAGADFVKTSSGFGPGGATVEDVACGIRTAAQLRALLEAGADRIGTSATVAILRELGG
jgi:deoxyribose-phosphate aldolase